MPHERLALHVHIFRFEEIAGEGGAEGLADAEGQRRALDDPAGTRHRALRDLAIEEFARMGKVARACHAFGERAVRRGRGKPLAGKHEEMAMAQDRALRAGFAVL